MRATAQAVPFIETDCPDIFAHRMGRVEILTDSMVRLWWIVEETSPEGVRHVLVARVVVPLAGVLANHDLIASALTGKATVPSLQAALH